MNNTLTNANRDALVSNFETSGAFPIWVKVIIGFSGMMTLLSLYQRDWKMLCISLATVFMFFSGKERQMSRPVKIFWAIGMFGLVIVAGILTFKDLFSRGR